MRTIEAIFENGVFRPLEPINFPEGTRVDLHNLRIVAVEPGQDLEVAQRLFDEALNAREHGGLADRLNKRRP
jgi:predicted DNA-binding antitoxin AbrB/MazE fold protein